MKIPLNTTTALAYETIADIYERLEQKAQQIVKTYVEKHHKKAETEEAPGGIVVSKDNQKTYIYYDYNTQKIIEKTYKIAS
jgi:tRNA(Ile2) C34 agmatinyltransferase TiaS